MQHLRELKFNQAEAYGGQLQQHLPWPVQINRAHKSVTEKVMISTPTPHLHQHKLLRTQEGLQWSCTRVQTSLHSALAFPPQNSEWWRDYSSLKDLRNEEFRPVQAAVGWQPFLKETGAQQECAPQTVPLWSCHDAVPWGKGDRRWMPRHGSDGGQLSRLRGFVLLALAQLVPSWSCTLGARVWVRNVQVLLCLAQRIGNELVSLCEAGAHSTHKDSGAVSSLL